MHTDVPPSPECSVNFVFSCIISNLVGTRTCDLGQMSILVSKEDSVATD